MTKQSRKTAIPVRVEQRRKTATLNLRIDPSLKETAEAAVAADDAEAEAAANLDHPGIVRSLDFCQYESVPQGDGRGGRG